ncbi:MAG: hypothetical protein ACI4S2_12165, partial [Lachnospiraceae bacterium]
VLKLSDLYTIKEEKVSLELKAVLLNINLGYNEELLSTCKTLRDYAEYTDRVRKYAENAELEDAVEQAITECIREGILAEFLLKNRVEAKRMSIYEYDEEKHMRQTRAEGYEEGKNAGMIKGEAIGMQKGEAIGMQKGEAIGMQKGEAVGMQKGEAIGMQKGEALATERLNCLNRLLAEQNRMEDIAKAASDQEYQKKLLDEFGL